MLVRLLYASRPTTATTNELVDAILASSHRRNPGAGITGILCYTPDLFIQVLEGSRPQVGALYNTIARDPRHRDVQLLAFEEVHERKFANWMMGRVNLAKVNPATILRYSETEALDPFALSARISMLLLDELLATAAVISR